MNEKKEQKTAKILSYKGKPLVRKGGVLCFGDAKTDKYIMMIDIKETKPEQDMEIASNAVVFIKDTENDTFVKYTSKDSLYEAFEIGEIWLDQVM
jgi:hypothetical protein